MLTKEEVIEELKTRNFSEVARNIPVTRVYLSRLADGQHPNVSYEIIRVISEYLESTK